MPRTHTTQAASLTDIAAIAIGSILRVEAKEGETPTTTIVFSGEGHTPADATRDATADIVAQCQDHRCSPASVTVDGTMRTDNGYRVWGTLGCIEGEIDSSMTREIPQVTMTGGEGEGWTLTISEE